MSYIPPLSPKAPKMSRLDRGVIITEKIDGTNGGIFIDESDDGATHVTAASKNRWLYPASISGDKSTDNFGFAQWVADHEDDLIQLLGPGFHRGEWCGQGIGRNYSMKHRAFLLFNVDKHADVRGTSFEDGTIISIVPVLYRGTLLDMFDPECAYGRAYNDWSDTIEDLRTDGSNLVCGWMTPEGVVVYHTASGQSFKYTFDKNDSHKGSIVHPSTDVALAVDSTIGVK